MHEYETHGDEDGHGVDVVVQAVWPDAPPALQKQQSTTWGGESPRYFRQLHTVVLDPAAAWETPHVCDCDGHGVGGAQSRL